MAEWKRRGNFSSVEEFLAGNGLDPKALISPTRTFPAAIAGMVQAAETISGYIRNDRSAPVYIIGDYDADGVTATAILTLLLRYFGAEPTTIIPKRFTDGYGISCSIIDGIQNSLIITVDNGIVALEPIKAAKQAGNTVIVLDHHLPGAELPEADVLVDPHIDPSQNGFVDYCGAGLAFKLAEFMLREEPIVKCRQLFNDIIVLAALGTIADVMPLVGDNRCIVKDGLKIMNAREREPLSAGIKALLSLVGSEVDEDTIKFKLGPMLNAPGRLYNAGSTSTLKALLCDDLKLSAEYAEKINMINERRKDLSAQWLDIAAKAGETQQIKKNLLVVLCKEMPEGLTGLVAGKLAEQFQCPTFVFAEAKETPGLVKGSGRSFGGVDISVMLPVIKDITVAAGGHAGAAGISVMEEHFTEMYARMQAIMDEQPEPEQDETVYYDLVLDPHKAKETLEALKRYAPFGEGVPKPVFMYQGFRCTENRYGEYFRMLGNQSQHLKLHGRDMDAIGFQLSDVYSEEGKPVCVDLAGMIGENTYNGCTSLQFEFSYLRKSA